MINRTVIVTGAAGYIGGAISIELHRQGYYVIGIDRRPLPDHLTKYFINFVQDEFNSPKSKLELLSLPAAIIHCAGTSLVGPSVKNPEEYYDNNVSKTLSYITNVRKYSPTTKFIFSSSASVYGDPETNISITEKFNTKPISPYGESKLMTEMMLKSFREAYGFKSVSFRYFNACGAVAGGLHGQEPDATHIFARLFESIKNNIPFYLYGTDYSTADGTCVRDYIHVTDIAKAHISEFGGMPSIIELQSEYESLLKLDNLNPHDRKSKSFIQRLVDDDFSFNDTNSALAKYCLNEEVAKACAMYLDLVPKLTSFKIWRSHQTDVSERSASQNWHRDYNEFQMIRIFLYFNEVNSNNGAGEYVSGTHFLGDSYEVLQDSEDGVSRYSSESDVRKAFSKDKLVTADGGAGTLYFVDTAGLHRGGYHPVPGERRVALTTFSTAADLMETKVRRPKNIELSNFMKKVLI
jgi:UDP-glucose 4-epimerase